MAAVSSTTLTQACHFIAGCRPESSVENLQRALDLVPTVIVPNESRKKVEVLRGALIDSCRAPIEVPAIAFEVRLPPETFCRIPNEGTSLTCRLLFGQLIAQITGLRYGQTAACFLRFSQEGVGALFGERLLNNLLFHPLIDRSTTAEDLRASLGTGSAGNHVMGMPDGTYIVGWTLLQNLAWAQNRTIENGVRTLLRERTNLPLVLYAIIVDYMLHRPEYNLAPPER